MKLKSIKRKARYFLQYLPFTMHTLLWILAIWLCYYLLYTPAPEEAVGNTNSFRSLILLMAKIAFLFVLVLCTISVVSAIVSWLYYIWQKKRKGHLLQLEFQPEQKRNRPRILLDASLPAAIRPILGFVKGRIFYDDFQMTDKFPLLSNKRKDDSWRRIAIEGKSRLLLPDIKEYQLQGGFLYFEDMLQLISLPVRQPVSGNFYQPPIITKGEEKEVFPKKTENTDVRIEQMRKVEGDYFNYKDFEAGDDVRRIVWKVYARNRELVVRIPEMFEPYASHLYFYASFDAGQGRQWFGEAHLTEMLNYYKNRVWTIYDTLSKKDWEIRFIPDQVFHIPEGADSPTRVARIISNSNWQQENSVSVYFNPRQGAVLCISSLTDPKELATVLDQCDNSTVVYYIKLSRVFNSIAPLNWMQRLLFQPPKDRLSRLRSTWILSPARLKIKKQEKIIEKLLQDASVNIGTL